MGNPIRRYLLAGDQGFEPRLTVPETAVLPLDESPTSRVKFYHSGFLSSNQSCFWAIFFLGWPSLIPTAEILLVLTI